MTRAETFALIAGWTLGAFGLWYAVAIVGLLDGLFRWMWGY